MTIFDRYLLSVFLWTFTICFLSFAGLFVVVHLFSNLDELSALSEKFGWSNLLIEFYGPRIAEIFDKTSSILILTSAIFAVSLLKRRREMTAVEAAGVTKMRILRPIFFLSLLLIGLTVANREIVLPKYKKQLVQTAQTWGDFGNVDLSVQEDLETGIVVRGDQLVINQKKITSPDVQLPVQASHILPRVNAEWAILEPANEIHPAGLRLFNVSNPTNLAKIPSLEIENGPKIMYSPFDQKWLAEDQCFVACNFELDQMAYGPKMANYLTTPELIKESRKPRRWKRNEQKIKVHSRFVRPVLDLTLLLLGLPLVMGAIERNVFVSFGICFWIVASFQLTIAAAHFCGASGLITPPALAAWLPALIFTPLAFVSMRKLRR